MTLSLLVEELRELMQEVPDEKKLMRLQLNKIIKMVEFMSVTKELEDARQVSSQGN
jgi:hypothetical protein